MRVIGHIPNKDKAAIFSDFLYVQGITNSVEQENDGYAVWIHSEDEMDRAKTMLGGFLANPADPQYAAKARKATALKEQEVEEEVKAAEKYFDRERTFKSTLPGGVGPVTAVLILASVVVTALASFPPTTGEWVNWLTFSNYARRAPELMHGQLWRLVTPIFLHADLRGSWGIMHIFFNAYCLYFLGSALEHRHSSGWLLTFSFIIAALSNPAEYFISGHPPIGLSGVVYGLLGYLWIRGKVDPNFGLALPTQTVVMMLVWYFLCLFKYIHGMANVVHTVGLLAGMGWGFVSGYRRS
jgi:GlpG protein